jgi:hypothetical protein
LIDQTWCLNPQSQRYRSVLSFKIHKLCGVNKYLFCSDLFLNDYFLFPALDCAFQHWRLAAIGQGVYKRYLVGAMGDSREVDLDRQKDGVARRAEAALTLLETA